MLCSSIGKVLAVKEISRLHLYLRVSLFPEHRFSRFCFSVVVVAVVKGIDATASRSGDAVHIVASTRLCESKLTMKELLLCRPSLRASCLHKKVSCDRAVVLQLIFASSVQVVCFFFLLKKKNILNFKPYLSNCLSIFEMTRFKANDFLNKVRLE